MGKGGGDGKESKGEMRREDKKYKTRSEEERGGKRRSEEERGGKRKSEEERAKTALLNRFLEQGRRHWRSH